MVRTEVDQRRASARASRSSGSAWMGKKRFTDGSRGSGTVGSGTVFVAEADIVFGPRERRARTRLQGEGRDLLSGTRVRPVLKNGRGSGLDDP